MATRNWHNLYKQQRRYVLLDRDGVINRRPHGGYVTSWDKFEFLPRALEALRLLSEHDYTALVISNQSCVGRGMLSSYELDVLTRRFLLEVALSGGNIAQVYYCRHRAEDQCHCRKPQPGMPLRARAEHGFIPRDTFFIGESQDDLSAAEAAGCQAIRIQRETFLEAETGESNSTLTASNLYEAAEIVLSAPKYRAPQMAIVRR